MGNDVAPTPAAEDQFGHKGTSEQKLDKEKAMTKLFQGTKF